MLALSDIAITQIVSAIVALAGVMTAYISLKKQMAENAKVAAERDVELNKKVERIEVHTNGMTEKLNDAMKLAGISEGMDRERTRAASEKGQRAQGAMDERERAETKDAPTLIVEEGKVVANDPERTPIVVDMKSKPGIIADEKKG